MNDTNNRKPTMDLQEFERLVSSYGANEQRWPEELRGEMRAFLDRSEDARTIVERETGLDGLLETVAAPPAASDLLRARVLKSAKEARASRTERLDHWAAGLWPPGRAWGPIAALAAAAMLGLVVGTLAPASDTEADNSHYDTDSIETTLDQLSAMGETP